MFACCYSSDQSVYVPRVYLKVEDILARKMKRIFTILKIDSITGDLPVECSLEQYQNFVYNQQSLGSCTANAFCGGFRIKANCPKNVEKKLSSFIPSRLFFYYNERAIENTTNTDSGANVCDGLKYVLENGICSESSCPYVISQFAKKPSDACYKEALSYKISSYGLIPQNSNVLDKIKQMIVQGEPVLIAIKIYESFESLETSLTGVVPMPDVSKEKCLGGHEMCLIGYNELTQRFLVLNSWGILWGHFGKCFIPYSYLLDTSLTMEISSFYL